MSPDSTVIISKGYVPGSIGRIAELHGTYYARHWGFGLYFEAKVATDLSMFMTRYEADRDAIWLAEVDDRVEGGIVIDGSHGGTEGAHLRWFILSDALRGQGVGRRLITAAIDFCKVNSYPNIYLWTFEGLDAARRLYESVGFVMSRQRKGDQWGMEVNEQKFICDLV
ncbi:MAG: GNAT family N-acetyltransferase [Desulfosarcina sp.]|jgi:GNAT superfamily N-acetyltransferase